MKITVVGLGPGSMEQLSLGAYEALLSPVPLYIRTKDHPNIPFLEKRGMKATYLDSFYERATAFEDVYRQIADHIIREVKRQGEIIYAVPGHPCVAESTVEMIVQKAKEEDIEVELIPSMSFIDATLAEVMTDPCAGFSLRDALTLDEDRIETADHLLITQIYDPFVASEVKLKLLEIYPHDKMVYLVKNAGIKTGDHQVRTICLPLAEIDRGEVTYDHLTSLFLPADRTPYRQNLKELIEIVRTLRGEGGCPWDQKQTHDSLKENIVEEATEVKDAIQNQDIDNLIEELGDVLLQIVFHSELGKESGDFDLRDVTEGICQKLVYRHPHVFAGLKVSENDLPDLWERLKKEEKSQKILKNKEL